MDSTTTSPIEAPPFGLSVVIAVYNDWEGLERCLRSLDDQQNAPPFEVIVVDDGSHKAPPESLSRSRSFNLTVVRQSHEGIPSARNRGVHISKRSVLLFTDADCQFLPNSLAALSAAIAFAPEHSCFQLRLVGDLTSLVGRAEELRLIGLQNQLLQPSGCIRYLNTAGFAIRRGRFTVDGPLFDPSALRGEDTLLLASLMQRGELPFLVTDAVVRHTISLSVARCLQKDVRSAWLEGRTYELIAAKGVSVRMSHRERLRMLQSMWRIAHQQSIGSGACFLLVARQSLQRIVSLVYRCLHLRANIRATRGTSC